VGLAPLPLSLASPLAQGKTVFFSGGERHRNPKRRSSRGFMMTNRQSTAVSRLKSSIHRDTGDALTMNKDTYTAQANTWARTSDEQLEAFFRDPDNFQPGMRIAAVIYAVGRYDSETDMDRGRWVYEWRRKSIRAAVETASAYVKNIALLDKESGNVIEILWEHPEYSNHV
jgi:hypothetical protein